MTVWEFAVAKVVSSPCGRVPETSMTAALSSSSASAGICQARTSSPRSSGSRRVGLPVVAPSGSVPSASSSSIDRAATAAGLASNSRTPRSSSLVTMRMSRAKVSKLGMPLASSGSEPLSARVAMASVPPMLFES